MKILFLLLAAACMALPGIVFFAIEQRKSRLDRHIEILFGRGATELGFGGRSAVTAAAARVGNSIFRSGLFSSNNREALQKSLQKAGINDANALPIFLGAKILCALVAASSALFISSSILPTRLHLLGAVTAGFLFGMLLPDFVIGRKRTAYLEKLKSGIPDMLDMMVICAEAGLNLEAALERVGLEMRFAHPEISRELTLTMNDIRVMSDRDRALLNMGARTGLPALERLATTLVQALRFGTPVRQALRILATELRGDALTSYETRAAKLPVFLTIPMILFILPSLFMVIMGPAVLSLMHQFRD